jgi:hypothetical protein
MLSSYLLAFLLAVVAAVGFDPPSRCNEIGGNWYCSPVDAISYTNFGNPGKYREVTGMYDDGTCSSMSKSFSGPMSPLNEEVSFSSTLLK